MTMPNERTRAVFRAKTFLQNLLNPKKTPKVPKSVRQEASRVLRHFPSAVDLIGPAKNCPEVFDGEIVDQELDRLDKEFCRLFNVK